MELFQTPRKDKDISSMQAYEYAEIYTPTAELEDIIAASGYCSYKYACNILHGRFLKGEKAISTNAAWSYFYARDVLNDRFYEGERAIMCAPLTSYSYALKYAQTVMYHRWLRAEPIIRKSAYWNMYKEHFNIE